MFTIDAAEDDTLRLIFVGYEPLRLRVSLLGEEVRLVPLSTLMDEVTVLPMESILQRVYDKLTRDFTEHRKETSTFFLRQSYDIAGTREMVEGFVQCRSTVNLRDIRFCSGRHFRASDGPADKASMVFSNLHVPLSLAPMVRDERFWTNLVTPLSRKPDVVNSPSGYTFRIKRLKQDDGKEMLCIDFRGDELRKLGMCFLEGTDTYDNVYAYPNPVRPEYTGWITVTGLMDQSLVKIADAGGNVIYQTRSNGGMITWDGCDRDGNRVRSGVYYVFASQNATGDASGAVTKIVVIN